MHVGTLSIQPYTIVFTNICLHNRILRRYRNDMLQNITSSRQYDVGGFTRRQRSEHTSFDPSTKTAAAVDFESPFEESHRQGNKETS
mmetsp:Transcript_19091/g.21889  ORF Transcript_19091/g.21889 Transcript_19091/m.21889 type:complete len:87 (+) Transcript_19091:281-541(+)